MSMHKRGQLASLQSIIITLVVIGIVLGVGFTVLESFRTQMTTGSAAQNATNSTIVALTQIPTWLSIIVLIAVVGIILAIVFSVLPRSSGTSV